MPHYSILELPFPNTYPELNTSIQFPFAGTRVLCWGPRHWNSSQGLREKGNCKVGLAWIQTCKVESVQDFATNVIMKQWHSHLDAQIRLLNLPCMSIHCC